MQLGQIGVEREKKNVACPCGGAEGGAHHVPSRLDTDAGYKRWVCVGHFDHGTALID